MKKYLKQDNFLLGIIIAAVLPCLLFAILYFLNIFIAKFHYGVAFLQVPTLQLLSIVVNVFLLRYYLAKLKYDKAGRGILLVTFVYILAYFVNDILIK